MHLTRCSKTASFFLSMASVLIPGYGYLFSGHLLRACVLFSLIQMINIVQSIVEFLIVLIGNLAWFLLKILKGKRFIFICLAIKIKWVNNCDYFIYAVGFWLRRIYPKVSLPQHNFYHITSTTNLDFITLL